jgi:hypothetical protein
VTDDTTEANRVEATRKLNAQARSNPGIACPANMTIGFQSLSDADRIEALAQVIAFANFTGENDPHGEQDFGAVYRLPSGEWTQHRPKDDNQISETVFWKIDYYDNALEFGSETPWDEATTTRVMTIMLSSEY